MELPKCFTTNIEPALLRDTKIKGGRKAKALPDTGSQVNLISPEQSRHATKTNVRTITLGSVEKPNAMTLKQEVTITHYIGNQSYTDKFYVADLKGKPDMILGTPWLRKFCPQVLDTLKQLGETSKNRRPSEKTDAAFEQGGIYAAIVAEDHFRQRLLLEAKQTNNRLLTIHTMIAQIETEIIAKDQPEDPGIRGLTQNKEGWEQTIPPRFRKYNESLFADPRIGDLPPHRPGFDCEITLRDENKKLKACKLYAMSERQLKNLKSLLDHELALNFLRPSSADESSPVFFVTDPASEGRNKGQERLVVDYRGRNDNLKFDAYPIPLSRTILQWIAGKKFGRKFDARGGFRAIRMAEGSEKYLAFKTQFGQFEPTVMPMGLATAPAIYQRFINHVLQPFLGVCCYAYLDDIIIVADTQKELDDYTDQILEVLAQNHIRLKPSKCVWNEPRLSFLGYTVEFGKGLQMARDKMAFIRNIKSPRGLHDLRSMLGMTNFYRMFIPHYADITASLTNLTKKEEKWRWENAEQEAWDRVLKAIREDVFLAGFKAEKPIELGTDASDTALGGYIAQPDDTWTPDQKEEDWIMRPVIFFHHKLGNSEIGWDAGDKELGAIVHAFDEFPDMLSNPTYEINVWSDHQKLSKFMFTTDIQRSHEGRLTRWWEKLVSQRFIIRYRPGTENVVADFLTRYGMDDSAALESKILLPLHRFSPEAQNDITKWFKKSPSELNIREKLEKSFQGKGKHPLNTEQNQFLEKLNDSPDPVPDPDTIMGGTMMATHQRATFADAYRLQHPTAQLVEIRAEHVRQGRDKRGLGFTAFMNKLSGTSRSTLP